MKIEREEVRNTTQHTEIETIDNYFDNVATEVISDLGNIYFQDFKDLLNLPFSFFLPLELSLFS